MAAKLTRAPDIEQKDASRKCIQPSTHSFMYSFVHQKLVDNYSGRPALGLRLRWGELGIFDGVPTWAPKMLGSCLYYHHPPPEGTQGAEADEKQRNHLRNSIPGDYEMQSMLDKVQGQSKATSPSPNSFSYLHSSKCPPGNTGNTQ